MNPFLEGLLLALEYAPSVLTDVEQTLTSWHKDPSTAGKAVAVQQGINKLFVTGMKAYAASNSQTAHVAAGPQGHHDPANG